MPLKFYLHGLCGWEEKGESGQGLRHCARRSSPEWESTETMCPIGAVLTPRPLKGGCCYWQRRNRRWDSQAHSPQKEASLLILLCRATFYTFAFPKSNPSTFTVENFIVPNTELNGIVRLYTRQQGSIRCGLYSQQLTTSWETTTHKAIFKGHCIMQN